MEEPIIKFIRFGNADVIATSGEISTETEEVPEPRSQNTDNLGI